MSANAFQGFSNILRKCNRKKTSFVGYKGGDAKKNTEQGNKYLNKILNNSDSTVKIKQHNDYGKIIEVRMPNGQGARWTSDGKRFIGFIEP